MEREKINDTNNSISIELIYMSSYIKYQSEITIIFPAKNGKPITFDKGERKPMRAQAELDAIRFWAIFVWLTITIASISCTTVV